MNNSRGIWTIFFAKFFEILTTGSFEIGKFLQYTQFFEQLRMHCIWLGSLDNKEKPEDSRTCVFVQSRRIP